MKATFLLHQLSCNDPDASLWHCTLIVRAQNAITLSTCNEHLWNVAFNADVMTPAQSSNSFVYDFRSLFSYSLCVVNLTQMKNSVLTMMVLWTFCTNVRRIEIEFHENASPKRKKKKRDCTRAQQSRTTHSTCLWTVMSWKAVKIQSFRFVCCAFVLNVSRSIQFEVTERRKIDSNVWRPAKTHFLELKWRNSIWFGKAPSSNRKTPWGEAKHATPFIAQISE